MDRDDGVWAKVCDSFLIDGVARLTYFSCSEAGFVVGNMVHTVALGAGLKRPFQLDDLLP